ncbi:tRNA 2-selenouridine(34) synthase MnmH [Peptoniphilus mikwangii]|uniref:tRNA 2-selenouridine(34) synthase MnmH n=1 Tax=Peptoniphilus mikwangii TaxID=1354300 RepID=UPI000405877C|nr:tRNA 2-selenouridine(34) synthase MnmH [Peptoniphilus mikwangii]
MFKSTEFFETLEFKNPLYIDLRSEEEFSNETIPGSINLPILNNEERKIVGILYVNGNVEEAKSKAVKFASHKLTDYYNYIANNCRNRETVLYCSRGGYRSTVLFNLLKTLDEPVYKLNFGYKGYRKYVMNELPKLVSKFNFINLNGYTGCGKTQILYELKKLGADVLDLEKLANHRGSLLGHIGLNRQPSQKMFESFLFDELRNMNGTNIFIESESTKIGSITVPKYLYDAYSKSGSQILITSSIDFRIKNIKDEYISSENKNFKTEINDALDNLSRYISEKRLIKYKQCIKDEDYDTIIRELIEKYYDQNYSIKKADFALRIDNSNSKECAEKIFNFCNEYGGIL